MSRSEYEYPEISEAPLAIVLCPSWSVVENVASVFQVVTRGMLWVTNPTVTSLRNVASTDLHFLNKWCSSLISSLICINQPSNLIFGHRKQKIW
jgi:hypothetical protein